MPPAIESGVRALVALAVAHRYVVLFLAVTVEEAGVPLPAPTDLVIAFYGFRAAGDFGALATVVFVCALASTIGTLVPYGLAWKFGTPVAHKLAAWLDVQPKRVDKWTERLARRGFIAVFVGRLIPGLRVAMSLVAGTAHVPLVHFTPAVFLAASIYWTLWVTLGVIFGPAVRDIVGPAYVQYVIIGVPVVVIAFIAWRVIRGRMRRSRAKAARAT